MKFLDQLGRQINQSVDRAKFEAEKFQKTTRLQGEANDLRRDIDGKLNELGQRAFELLRAGQINSATLAELANSIDQLRSSLIVKEEELKEAQAEVFVEPPPPPQATPSVQQVPISDESAPVTPPPVTQKICGVCNFQMPSTALFCPNCGTRVG
ncbi:MAG: zinc ribbon domain-containing protein [Oscillochloridaceae bacterium umkhey_bin13]